MAQQMEAETGGTSTREGIKAIRRDFSPRHVEERLGEAVSDRPLVQHLLEWRVIGRALAIAVVLTLVFLLLTSPPFAGFVLILSFFGGWAILGARDYNRRRPTKPVEDEEEASS